MKILHVLDHSLPLHSGYTFRTRAILDHQRARGWETAHLTSGKHLGGRAAVEEVDSLRFYRTSGSSEALARLPLLNQWDVVRNLERRLAEVIDQEHPDLLHAHSPSLNGIAAIRVGRQFALPVVYECRAFWEDAAVDHGTAAAWGPRYRLSRGLETWVFQRSDAVTCICDGLRADIVARGIAQDKVTVVPNGVDLRRFAAEVPRDDALAAELGLAGDAVFGFIGSFYAYEGLALAIRALPEIIREVPRVRLLLVGGGPEEEALRRLVHALGLGAHVVWSGRVPNTVIQRYYGLVDVLIYPRLSMRLTELVTPLKPLEAMALGKLVLASDVGGHRELIGNGDTGILFPADCPSALAAAALGLLRGRADWDARRRRARAFVERERSWNDLVERYDRVYDRALSGVARA